MTEDKKIKISYIDLTPIFGPVLGEKVKLIYRSFLLIKNILAHRKSSKEIDSIISQINSHLILF